MMKRSRHATPVDHWVSRFKRLYNNAIKRYRAGNREAETFFDANETAFLTTLGCRPIELYDFAEDHPAIDWETALLITAARREYYLFVQNGQPSMRRFTEPDLPARTAELGGIEWLPRIIAKAKWKLRGELPDDVMYCCGGDRAFLNTHAIHAADFLRAVSMLWDDDQRILDYTRARA